MVSPIRHGLFSLAAMLCAAPTFAASDPPSTQYCHQHAEITPAYQCFPVLGQAERFMRTDPPPFSCRRNVEQNVLSSYNSGALTRTGMVYVAPLEPTEEQRTYYSGFANDNYDAHCGAMNGCPTEADVLDEIKAYWNAPVLETQGAYSERTWYVFGWQQALPDGGFYVPGTAYYNCTSPGRSWRLPGWNFWHSLSKATDVRCPVDYVPKASNVWCDDPDWPRICKCNAVATIAASEMLQSNSCPVPGTGAFAGDGKGNPCSPSSGNKYQTEIDFRWGALTFSRTYNSLRLLGAKGHLGEAWTHNLAIKVSGWLSNPVFIEDERNLLEQFGLFEDGATRRYSSRNSLGQILERDSNGYVLKRPGGEWQRFDVQGRLTSLGSDAGSGDSLSLTYCSAADVVAGLCGAADALWRVRDARGRELVFIYDQFDVNIPDATEAAPRVRLAAITQDGIPLVEYDYDEWGRLVAAQYPGAAYPRLYHYAEPTHVCREGDGTASSFCPAEPEVFRYAMTGISDEKGARYADFTYDGYARGTSTRHAGDVDRYTFRYLVNRRTEVTFPLGTIHTYAYTGDGSNQFIKLSGTTTTAGSASYGYDAARRLTTKVDERGTQTTYEYADGIHITAQNDAVGKPAARRIEQAWNNSVNRMTSRLTKSATGTVVANQGWTYNARGQVATHTVTDPATLQVRTTTTTYCEAADVSAPGSTCPILGLVKAVDGPRTDVADVTTYTYYAADAANCASSPVDCTYRKGDLWKVTNAAGHVTEYLAYDNRGGAKTIKDPNGVVSNLTYHARGWLLSRETAGAVTSIAYDDLGQVTRVTQPDGAYLEYDYDDAHRLTDITDNAGNRIHYTLDAAGNRIREETRDPTGAVTRALARQVDTLGRIRSQIRSPHADAANLDDPSVRKTQYTFDANGNTDTVTDPLGRVTDNDYDPLDRLSKTISDYGAGRINATVQYEYDARDNLVKVIDPKNLATEYVYNGLNDLAELRSPDTGTTRYTYDSAGNRATQVDARNVTTQFHYDALNRLTSITYPSASSLDVTFGYDGTHVDCAIANHLGRLTSISDSSGSTALCYDARGNVIRKIQTTGTTKQTVRYAYDLADRLASVTYPSGNIAIYRRDAVGRIVAIDVSTSGGAIAAKALQPLVTNVTYLPFGPARELTFSNGSRIIRTYDANYAIDSIDASAATGLDLEFRTDDVGNIVEAGTSVGGAPSETYGYDNLDRLTQVLTTGGANVLTLTYDATGNRASKRVGSGAAVAYTYPSTTHRLSAVGSASRSYDAGGNTTARGDGFTFVYDARNRYSQYKRNNKVELTNNYNGRGERVTKTVGNAVTRFVYDEAGRLLSESAGTTSTDVVWMDDVPVAAIRGSTLSYIHADHLGTPRKVMDPARNVAVWDWPFIGNAFGEAAPNQNPDGDAAQFAAGWRFPGQYFDPESGLNYNYFRDYEPGTGRYVESDPIGLDGGLSTYGYALASPLIASDPRGLAVEVCCRLLDSVAGWLLRQRHCYFTVDGLSFGLYPESPRGLPTSIGVPRRGDPRDDGGKCKPCQPKECEGDPAACIGRQHESYPIGAYSTLGPNSNTYVGSIARSCCKGGVPSGLGSAPAIDQNPPPVGFGGGF